MKMMRTAAAFAGACALLALSGAPAGAATHSLPEAGTCAKVAAGSTGAYTGGNCTILSSNGRGKYEWTPAGALNEGKFEATPETVTLASPGHEPLSCLGANVTGTFTGAKTATAKIEWVGCSTNKGSALCQSPTNPQTKTQIESLPLEAEIGFIRDETIEKRTIVSVGMDFKPTAPLTYLAVYECAGANPGETEKLEGSIIARIKPIDKMTTEANMRFQVLHGVQVPQSFQGEPTDTLTTTFSTSPLESTSAPTTMGALTWPGSFSVPFEIKGLEKVSVVGS